MSGCLELKIIVRYEGLKATQYFSKFTHRSDDVFRDDLLALKLPHPKRGNTTFISHGCVECVWPLVPKNGILHKQVINRTDPRNPAEREALALILGRLSISNIAVKEIYPDSRKGRKYLKRPNPYTSKGVEEGSSSRLPSSQGNGYQVPPPVTETHSLHVSEAEAFLQDMSDSFRPLKKLKVEPVDDVPLPPEAPRSIKTLKQHRSSSSSLSSHLSSTSKITNPPKSASSSSSFLSPKPPLAKVVPLTPANHMLPPPSKPVPSATPISEPISLPAPILEMLRELQPLLLSKSQPILEPAQRLPTDPDQNVSLPIPTQPEPAKCQSIVLDQNMTLPIPTQPEPAAAQRQPIVLEQKNMTPPIPTQPKSFEANATSNRLDVSDVPEIQRLTRESCDIRRQIKADSVRDACIITKLKQLNAPFIPDPLKGGIPDSIMEGRIRKLEQDLDIERRMRLEAEDVVRDIRRECKAPFIVPGLLDAFIKLSRLTTQAARLNGTNNG